jgi:hypothetical protein
MLAPAPRWFPMRMKSRCGRRPSDCSRTVGPARSDQSHLPEAFQARFGPLLAHVTKTAAEYLRRSGEALASRRDPLPLDALRTLAEELYKRFLPAD